MRRAQQTEDQNQASDVNEPSAEPLDRSYLTDGDRLFHVERTLIDNAHGELLVELEDCATLDLLVCSACSIAELGLRPVQPLPLPTL
jgi:hypothetical protein